MSENIIKAVVSYSDIRKKLLKPNDSMSVNSLVASNLIRSLEMEMLLKEAEKGISDTTYIKKYVGKDMVFVADIAKVSELDVESVLTLGHLTLVGKKVGDVSTPLSGSISNLVAETYDISISNVDFNQLSGKLLIGTTLMFSARVEATSNGVSLGNISVMDFGLRLFKEDGSVDKLAIFNDLVDTHNFHFATVMSGKYVVNNYRNLSLEPYINSYRETGDKSHLHKASEYIIRTYDPEGIERNITLFGILK